MDKESVILYRRLFFALKGERFYPPGGLPSGGGWPYNEHQSKQWGPIPFNKAPSDEGAVERSETEGEKTSCFRGERLSLRQNLRFCHLPRQREVI